MRLLVEAAKSGRSTCKPCGNKIDKSDLRWIKESDRDGTPMRAYTHILCLNLSKKSREQLSEDDIEFEGEFSDEQKQEIKEAFHSTAVKKAKPSKGNDEGSTKSKKKKRKKEEDDDEGSSKKKSKKRVKKSGVEITSKERKAKSKLEELKDKYRMMTLGQLKDYLRANKQIMAGKKEELVERCADGELLGALPKCPRCLHGKLKKNFESDLITCRGYFDEDIKMTMRCKFEAKEVDRLKWLSPDDAEAQVKKEDKKSPGKENEEVSAKVLKKINKKFSSKELNPREAAKEMVKLCRKNGLALPAEDSDARQKVGSLFMEHRTDDGINYVEVYKELVKAYSGDQKPKEELPQAVVPENTELANLLQELSLLHAKFGGTSKFKAVALKKASINIRRLDFKVVSGKALASGKQKVEGIGKGTGAAIDEYLETGEIAEIAELKEKVETSGL